MIIDDVKVFLIFQIIMSLSVRFTIKLSWVCLIITTIFRPCFVDQDMSFNEHLFHRLRIYASYYTYMLQTFVDISVAKLYGICQYGLRTLEVEHDAYEHTDILFSGFPFLDPYYHLKPQFILSAWSELVLIFI